MASQSAAEVAALQAAIGLGWSIPQRMGMRQRLQLLELERLKRQNLMRRYHYVRGARGAAEAPELVRNPAAFPTASPARNTGNNSSYIGSSNNRTSSSSSNYRSSSNRNFSSHGADQYYRGVAVSPAPPEWRGSGYGTAPATGANPRNTRNRYRYVRH
ncbi:hypothetical protein KR038_004440 [Drosophila bunnanda]|nr:hypothetical protein KR038_004440 [Drosophila bunnanda]